MPIRIWILRKFFYRCLSFFFLDSGHRCHYFQYFGQHILYFLEITRFNWIRIRTRLRIGDRGCQSGSAKNDADLTGSGLAGPWCRSGSAKNYADLAGSGPAPRPLMSIRILQKSCRSSGSGSTILFWRAQKCNFSGCLLFGWKAVSSIS